MEISLTEEARSSDVNILARPKSPASNMHNIIIANYKTRHKLETSKLEKHS